MDLEGHAHNTWWNRWIQQRFVYFSSPLSVFDDLAQHIDSNGQDPMLNANAGMKKSTSSRKKCGAPSSFSNRSPQAGWPRPPHPHSKHHPLPCLFSKGSPPTPFNTPKSLSLSMITSYHFGTASWLWMAQTVNQCLFPCKSKMKYRVLMAEMSNSLFG